MATRAEAHPSFRGLEEVRGSEKVRGSDKVRGSNDCSTNMHTAHIRLLVLPTKAQSPSVLQFVGHTKFVG